MDPLKLGRVRVRVVGLHPPQRAQGDVCMAEFDEYFLDYDDMIEWSKRYDCVEESVGGEWTT